MPISLELRLHIQSWLDYTRSEGLFHAAWPVPCDEEQDAHEGSVRREGDSEGCGQVQASRLV